MTFAGVLGNLSNLPANASALHIELKAVGTKIPA